MPTLPPKVLQRIEKLGVETNIYIALCGAVAAILPFLVFAQPIPVWFPILVAGGVWSTYTWQKLSPANRAIRSFRSAKGLAMILVPLLCLALAFRLSWLPLAAMCLAGILAVTYVMPVIPGSGRKLSLREYPYTKIWTVWIVWVLVVIAVPLLEFWDFRGIDAKIAFTAFLIGQSAFLMALIIPFDIRDLRVDSPQQRTLPMWLGVERSKTLARSCLVLAGLSVVLISSIGAIELPTSLALIFGIFIAHRVIRRTTPDRKDRFYTILVDGCLVVQPLLVFITKIF